MSFPLRTLAEFDTANARQARRLFHSETNMAKKSTTSPKTTPKGRTTTPGSPARTGSSATTAPAKSAAPRAVTQEMIAKRAYEIYVSGQGGTAEENWHRAETELRGQ